MSGSEPWLRHPAASLGGEGLAARCRSHFEGKADATALTFVMKNLEGKVIEQVEFKPLA